MTAVFTAYSPHPSSAFSSVPSAFAEQAGRGSPQAPQRKGAAAIQSSSYKLLYQVGEDTTTELAEKDNTYTLTSDTTVITLKATGTAGSTGYCSIKVGDETCHIIAGGTFTFTVKAAADTTITLTPKWGTYSNNDTLSNGGDITATGSQQSITQTSDNAVTTEPSAEPAAPTSPTTPSSTPAESDTPTTELSTTTPTEPETTDPEPTPATEDTTPENTTEAQNEPPTTEESENN